MFVKKAILLPLALLPVYLLSCTTTSYQAQSVQYKDYRIDSGSLPDSSLLVLIKPYGDSVNKSINAVIAESEAELTKQQPEGTLNNLLADAMLVMAKENYKVPVDASFMNYGGIRLPALPAGNITRGKIFELSPFDNVLLLLKVRGDVLQSFLDHTARKGGWPCAGISYQVSNGKAVNVRIGGVTLDAGKTYTIATIDYVANGGDDCSMLRNIPQVNNGYLLRDAIIAYFMQQAREGKKLSAKLENRVTNAN